MVSRARKFLKWKAHLSAPVMFGFCPIAAALSKIETSEHCYVASMQKHDSEHIIKLFSKIRLAFDKKQGVPLLDRNRLN